MSQFPLDQVSSQALSRLAAERGRPSVTPAGEEAVRRASRGWKRWLPYLFFALSLFSLGAMALGISALVEDGWSWSDGIQFALMAILVAGVVSQGRTMLRPTRAGRWFAARRRSRAAVPCIPPALSGYTLDAVSAEYLAAVRPASAVAMRRRAAVRRAGSRLFDRFSVATVLALAGLGFVGMVFILGLVIYSAGASDPSVWLTAPFTALTGFATWQLFGSARKMSFRGRPFALVSRTFRDSVRVWGSGSVATKVAVTTTATASVAGAAVVPALVQPDTQLDMFLIDRGTAAVYRIDLATDTSFRSQVRDVEAVKALALATNPAQFKLESGKVLPKGSLVVVLEGALQRSQGIVAFRPNEVSVTNVSRIDPPIPGARFAAGPGVLFAVQDDGAFWHVDMRTGAATRVGQLAVPPGPMTYEADSRTIIMASAGQVVRLEPASGSLLASNPGNLPEEERVCGIADGPGDLLFLSIEGQPEIRAIHTKSRAVELIRPTGDFAPEPCQLAVAYRK